MPLAMERIYSVHLKKEHVPHVVAVGLATVHLDDIVAWMWGKDSKLYLFAIDDVEYDLECKGDIEEKMRGIVDFHDAFYRYDTD